MAKLTIDKNPSMKNMTGGQSRGELLDKISKLEQSVISDIEADKITTASPFKELFPVKEEMLESITEDMKKNGFDRTQPLIIWKEKKTLIDGHTRLQAVKNAGIKEVPVIYVSLKDREAATEYAYALQFKRRNLTEGEKFGFAENYLCNVAQTGKNESGWKKNDIASILSCSLRTAQKYITVIKNASLEDKECIKQGEKTINQVYNSLRESDEKEAAEETLVTNQIKFNKKAGELPPNKKMVSIEEDFIKETVESWREKEHFTLMVSTVSKIMPPMSNIKIHLESIIFNEKFKNT